MSNDEVTRTNIFKNTSTSLFLNNEFFLQIILLYHSYDDWYEKYYIKSKICQIRILYTHMCDTCHLQYILYIDNITWSLERITQNS